MAKPSSSNNQQHAKVQSRAARVAVSQGKESTLKGLVGETSSEEAQAMEASQSASSMPMHRDLKRDLKGGSGVKSTSRTSRSSPSGTAAAMKSLAQKHAASLRPSLSIDEIS
ncbi:MAG: hypothetical protein N2515_05145, partial [Deltaproteobacteria bacterium]|nr:hypothetical protein [Deltaproteobacteria bacterium]